MAGDNKELKEDVKEVKLVCNALTDKIVALDKVMVEHRADFRNHIENDRSMYEEFKRLNDILQQNTDSLKEHIHRTNLLEKSVQTLDERLCPVELEIIRKKAIREWLKGGTIFAAKIAGGLSALLAIYMAVRHLIH